MILSPTKDKGATAKAAPGLYGESEQLVTREEVGTRQGIEGLDGGFVADLLSGFLAHERCGVHLYRSAASRSNNPRLRQHYARFGAETAHHVEVLEQLVTAAGANPAYVSPMARAVEATDSKLLESTFMLDGTLDPVTAEMAMLDAVFLAESVDQANWRTLGQLARETAKGPLQESLREAVEEVLGQEDAHLSWAVETRAKLTMLQAKASPRARVGEKAEEMLSQLREWLS